MIDILLEFGYCEFVFYVRVIVKGESFEIFFFFIDRDYFMRKFY